MIVGSWILGFFPIGILIVLKKKFSLKTFVVDVKFKYIISAGIAKAVPHDVVPAELVPESLRQDCTKILNYLGDSKRVHIRSETEILAIS